MGATRVGQLTRSIGPLACAWSSILTGVLVAEPWLGSRRKSLSRENPVRYIDRVLYAKTTKMQLPVRGEIWAYCKCTTTPAVSRQHRTCRCRPATRSAVITKAAGSAERQSAPQVGAEANFRRLNPICRIFCPWPQNTPNLPLLIVRL